MNALVAFLVFLLVIAIVGGFLYYVVTLLPLPEPFKRIATLAVLLIILLIILVRALPLLGVAV